MREDRPRQPFPFVLLALLLALGAGLPAVGCGGEDGGGVAAPVETWANDPTTQTRSGALRGVEDAAETWVWRGVPFAAPPVGDLRWKAPREPEPWEDVREASTFSEPCTQYAILGHGMLGEEDCLYLNVWRPRSEETGLPVYVWFHGGGNSIGSAVTGDDYNGANLAHRSNLVVVTANYRLGVMGWFTHPALRKGEPGGQADDSGNYGTLDQIRVLDWIRRNARAFGGDPDRVMITGESAGAADVLTLLISPLARGLFHRAMSESGGTRTASVEEGDEAARQVIRRLLVTDGTAANEEEADAYLRQMSDAEIEGYLRSKTDRELLRTFEPGFGGMIPSPELFTDGWVLPAAGFDTLDTGTYPNKVPVILGTNKEEQKLFFFPGFLPRDRDELYTVVSAYGSDAWKVRGVDAVARSLRRNADQPGVYAYQFLWGAGGETGESVIPEPWGFLLGSCHTLEIPFFFGNDDWNVAMHLLAFTEENRPGREALSGAMMAYAARFARTGNPNAPGSGQPLWNPWSNAEGGPKTLLLDVDDSQALDIRMSDVELTREGLEARLAEEVPEPLYTQAIEYLGWERRVN